MLLLALAAVYARLPFLDALRCGAAALFVGIVAQVLAGALQKMLVPAAVLVPCLVIAALCGIYASRYVVVFGEGRADIASPVDEGIVRRFGMLVRTVWGPLCGLTVCSFLLGTLWMQVSPALQAEGGVDWVGPLVVAAVLLAVSCRISDYGGARRVFWLVIPLTALLFLLTFHFDAIATPLSGTLVPNLQNGASAALLVCLCSLLLTAARTTGLPVAGVFGGCMAVIAVFSLVGFAVHAGAGDVANLVAVILFELYVCAAIVFLVVVGPDERESREAAIEAIESYMRPRCERLAERYGLTAREGEVLRYLARGHSYAFVAESLYVSEATVRTHARNIYRKLGVSSQEGLLQLIDAL